MLDTRASMRALRRFSSSPSDFEIFAHGEHGQAHWSTSASMPVEAGWPRDGPVPVATFAERLRSSRRPKKSRRRLFGGTASSTSLPTTAPEAENARRHHRGAVVTVILGRPRRRLRLLWCRTRSARRSIRLSAPGRVTPDPRSRSAFRLSRSGSAWFSQLGEGLQHHSFDLVRDAGRSPRVYLQRF